MKVEETVQSEKDSMTVPGLNTRLWLELQSGKIDKDGGLIFDDGRQLYTSVAHKSGHLEWVLDKPSIPDQLNGPFKITRDTWEKIGGGSLVASRGLIISKDGKLHRLTAVTLTVDRGEGEVEELRMAAAYAPAAHGPGPGLVTRATLPAITPNLWGRMEVGLWEDGGWMARPAGRIRHLHLTGSRGAEKWVLRSVDTRLGGPRPYLMPRDDWNRISCGHLLSRHNVIEKDGRLLRMLAVVVGKRRVVLTYAPRAHQISRRPSPPAAKATR